MKKKMFLGIGVLCVGLALAVTSCGGPGPGRCRGFHGRFIERKVRQIEEDLKLTDTQKTQFRELRGRIRNDIVNALTERKQLMATVREKVQGDTANVDELVAIARAQMRKQHARMEEKLSYISEFYNMLNPEQKRIFTQKVREHLSNRGDRIDGMIERIRGMSI